MKKNKQKGFSLIEIMIVLAIIGLLISFFSPLVKGYMESVKMNNLRAEFNLVYDAVNHCIISYDDDFPSPYELTTGVFAFASADYNSKSIVSQPTINFFSSLGEFLPEGTMINLTSTSSADLLNMSHINEVSTTQERVYLEDSSSSWPPNLPFNSSSGTTYYIVSNPNDTDPNTYSIILVPKDPTPIIANSSDPLFTYDCAEMDIIVVNENFCLINGGDLIRFP